MSISFLNLRILTYPKKKKSFLYLFLNITLFFMQNKNNFNFRAILYYALQYQKAIEKNSFIENELNI